MSPSLQRLFYGRYSPSPSSSYQKEHSVVRTPRPIVLAQTFIPLSRDEVRTTDVQDFPGLLFARSDLAKITKREEDRLTAQNDILYQLCGERYFFPRINNPRKILDCGYGRGDWVVQVAEEYEQCEVTGVDIYPALVADQPDNLTLFGYNLNERLNDPEVFERSAYDLIHSRFVAQGIKINRWAPYVQDMKRLVRPNGFVEMVEYYLNIQSDNGRLTTESALRRWWDAYVAAMQRSNRNPRIAQTLQQLLADAGFRDVGGTTLHLPIGGWHTGVFCTFWKMIEYHWGMGGIFSPIVSASFEGLLTAMADAYRASIGQKSVAMMGELLDSASLWLFTVRLGWTAAQVEALNNAARRELQDTSLRLYVPM
ncbi:hypothetical protein N0V90_009565 [Kalmusia sp. IMI 367209]|nr:hypothetical protein N0V90_009565 [Kalmusia sp. IMI 367209]